MVLITISCVSGHGHFTYGNVITFRPEQETG